MGLAPQAVDEVMATVVRLQEAGKTLVVVEQNAAMALDMADHAYVLVQGRNRLEGPGRQLLADPQVREVYLGGAGRSLGGDGSDGVAGT